MKPDHLSTVLGIVGLATIVLLSGCSPTPTTPVSTQGPHSNNAGPDSDDADPVVITAPTPFADLSCTELVPTPVIDAVIDPAVTLKPVVINQGYLLTDGFAATDEPSGFGIRRAGGLACEWSNSEVAILDGAENPDYAGVVVEVLPDAAAAWASFAAGRSLTASHVEYCGNYVGVTCELQGLYDGNWVSVRLYRVATPTSATEAAQAAAATPVLTAALAAIAGATKSSTAFVNPEGTIPLTDDCAQFLTAAEISTAIGMPVDGPMGGVPSTDIFSISQAANIETHIERCSWAWGTPPDDYYYDTVMTTWLTGGEWAWNEEKAAGAFTASTALDLPGLADGDAAYLTCPATPVQRCDVDLLVGHNWIWLSVYLDVELTATTPKDGATAVATGIVAALHS